MLAEPEANLINKHPCYKHTLLLNSYAMASPPYSIIVNIIGDKYYVKGYDVVGTHPDKFNNIFSTSSLLNSQSAANFKRQYIDTLSGVQCIGRK